MQDKPVAECRPFRLGNQHHERELDLGGVRMSREPQAARQPPDVRIYRDAGRVEGVSKDDVGGLATHPR